MPVPPDNPALAAQLHWHCQLLTFGQRPTPPLLNCCRLLPGQELASQSQNSFDTLRLYLRQLAVAAYQQKAAAVDDIEAGLMQEAQKFFVLTQTELLLLLLSTAPVAPVAGAVAAEVHAVVQ